MPTAPKATRPPVTRARLKARAALFVCTDCPLGSRRRRDFKQILKAAGRKREVRVARCGCLALCPKHGTAIALADQSRPARIAIVDVRARAEDALELLLDEGVSDPVPD